MAQASSLSPPGAPLTPMAPIVSLPILPVRAKDRYGSTGDARRSDRPRLRYRQGRARRQGEGHPWPRLRIGKVLLHPKEVPLCLTGTVSKICWRFCTGTLRRRLTRSHSIVGGLSMAICQWAKIHCLGDGSQFSTLVEGLGGAQKILDVNYYKHSHASLCLVLPPVGSARSAILLLECIEHFIGSALFSNPEIQIQVCSPGRLGARRSALLAIGFYLGSDTLRRYTLGDLATSFAENHHYPRGRRLVLYDAEGDFDRNFDWWKESGKHRLVEPQLPFENGRSDLLTGSGSRLDIQNINLLATLLVHAQYQGYWNQLGMQFQEEMEALLERHVLKGLVDAPWVRTDDPESEDDDGFFAALQELVAYAFEESVPIRKKGRLFLAGTRYQSGHLMEFCRKCSLCFRSTAVS